MTTKTAFAGAANDPQNPPLKGEEYKEGFENLHARSGFSTGYSRASLSKARSLRRDMTKAEHVLWQAIRRNSTGF